MVRSDIFVVTAWFVLLPVRCCAVASTDFAVANPAAIGLSFFQLRASANTSTEFATIRSILDKPQWQFVSDLGSSRGSTSMIQTGRITSRTEDGTAAGSRGVRIFTKTHGQRLPSRHVDDDNSSYTQRGIEYSTEGFRVLTASAGGTWDVGDVTGTMLMTAFSSSCWAKPTSADFDTVNGILYWSCPDIEDGAIYRTGRNESHPTGVSSAPMVSDLQSPGGVCVDPIREYMYYGFKNRTGVFLTGLDGGAKVAMSRDHKLAACRVNKGHVYFVNGDDSRLMVMNPRGDISEHIFNHSDTQSILSDEDHIVNETHLGNWSDGAFADLVAVDDVLYVTDVKQGKVWRITLQRQADSIPAFIDTRNLDADVASPKLVAIREPVANVPCPRSIQYSEALNALVIGSELSQSIYRLTLTSPQSLAQIYAGAPYGALVVCNTSCPLLPHTYG